MISALIVFHRWLALITSILIIVVSVTGSAMVFEGAIDRGLHPELWRVVPSKAVLSLDTVAARARAAAPGLPLSGMSLAREPDRAYVAQLGTMQVFVDQYTGRVLGTRDRAEFETSLPRRLHVLHTTLMAGTAGKSVVGLVSVASLLLAFTGVIIWWNDKLWRIRWSASWKRIVFDLHHALGVGAAFVLLVITASGAVIHFEALNRAIANINAVPRAPTPAQSPPEGVATPISLEALAQGGYDALPGASITFLSVPPAPTQPYTVAMRFPEDRTPGGRSRVVIDRYRGTVLRVDNTREAALGLAISNQVRSMHTGDIYGKPTEAIWLLASLILVSQAITGVLMWWNGRAARTAAARRS